MPSSDTIHKIALEGPLSVSALVALGLVVVLVCSVFTWRDCRASGAAKLFALLFLTRVTAVAIVLWMLAGATSVTLRHDTRAKSIVFLVDASGSMGMVDPIDGSGNAARWAGADGKAYAAPAIAPLDGVIGRLRSAQAGVKQIRELQTLADSGAETQKTWERVHQEAAAAADETEKAATEAAKKDPEAAAELRRIAGFLREGLASSGSGSTLTRANAEDRLDEFNSLVEGGLDRVERQTQKLASEYEQTPSPQQQVTLTDQSRLSRNEKITTWLTSSEKSWLTGLEDNVRLARYTFNSEVQPVADRDWRGALDGLTNTGAAGATDLKAALARAVQDASRQPLGAVVLVTDGGHNVASDPRDVASSLRGVPLYVVPIGSTEMPRDVMLHHVQAPHAAFKNDVVLIDAMVSAFGCPDETITVELLSDGTVVDRKTLQATGAVYDGRLTFHWKADNLGRHVLRLRAVPLPKEASLDNNEVEIPVEVMEDTIRVLLADNYPRWEFRYLANLFKRDKHIEFEQLLFQPNEQADQTQPTPHFPQTDAEWRRYRVVILGDVTPAQFPPEQQEMLRKYVADGGGNLVVIAGDTAMPASFASQPLGAMIPAVPGAPPDPRNGFSLEVTVEGTSAPPTQLEDDALASQRIWREMTTRLPIYNLSAFSKPKPTAHVLIAAVRPQAGAEAEAYMSWQYIGDGRVIYLSAPISYELRYGQGDLYHHRFWGQLLRWAIAREMSGGSKTVHLTADKNVYTQGDDAQVSLRLSELDGQPVTGGKINIEAYREHSLFKTVEAAEEPGSPGFYHAKLDDLPVGRVTFRAAGPKIQSLLHAESHPDPVEETVVVDPTGNIEMNNPVCNLPLLKQIADAAGGALLPPAALQNALNGLNVAPETTEVVVSRQPLWNRWSLLWIFIICLSTEWLARRYWRML